MSESTIANKQLAGLLGVLGHPLRIRIVEELRRGECDVNTLRSTLEIAHSGVSQHLSVLRTHRVVVERREGRRVVYRLTEPTLADWLLEGFRFLETAAGRSDEIRSSIQQIREAWAAPRRENGLRNSAHRIAAASSYDAR